MAKRGAFDHFQAVRPARGQGVGQAVGKATFLPIKSMVMVGPEGHHFLHKINLLSAGSPTRFLRILSYGLANPKIRTMSSFQRNRCSVLSYEGR